MKAHTNFIKHHCFVNEAGQLIDTEGNHIIAVKQRWVSTMNNGVFTSTPVTDFKVKESSL